MALFARLSQVLASKTDALVIFEAPGEIDLAPPGWTLVKRANTRQDMRLDVPSIGVHTIEKLKSAGAACLCVEAGKVILLEKQKVIELADRYKIAVVGYDGKPLSGDGA